MFTLDDIINTLNGVEVKGRDNMDRLLGAILALEAIKEAQSKAEAEQEKEAEGE